MNMGNGINTCNERVQLNNMCTIPIPHEDIDIEHSR